MEFLENVGSPFSDVYVNNQASSVVAAQDGELDMVDSYMMPKYEKQVSYENSFFLRGYMGDEPPGLAEAAEELTNGTFVCIGHYRGIVSPRMPLAASSTGWGKDIGFIGFDFYGKYKRNTTYGGVHVFVNSEWVSDEELNGINIDTYLQLTPGTDAVQRRTPQNDVISISDYRKFHKHDQIRIRTGFGSDCLNINGMIGEFHDDYANLFTANLGDGLNNILSFKGMTKDRDDIKGVFFDTKTQVLKYFHGEGRNTHALGTLSDVSHFDGSPFDDHVVLYKRDFKVYQTSGSNVYEFDFDELSLGRPPKRKFDITDQSKQPLKINLKTSDTNKIKANNIVLSYKKLRIYASRGRNRDIARIEVSLKNTTTMGNIFINDDNPRPLDHGHVNPRRINGEKKNLNIGQSPRNVNHDDGNEKDLLLLKWPTDQDPDSADYTIDMKGGTDAVIISDKHLLDPCGVDGETVTLSLQQGSDFDSTGAFIISIEKRDNDDDDVSSRINIELQNVEEIINEYGNSALVAFDQGSHSFPLDLFDRYMDVTRRTLNIKTTELKWLYLLIKF